MGRHVVLVEDEPNITEAIRFLLTRDGWRVDSHADGSDAVEVICTAKPDLVILDLMLPGKSGLEIIRELRDSGQLPDLPVLMLTARGQLRDREMAEQAGVTRFMTKPFSNNEVLTAVRDLHAQAAQNRAGVSEAGGAAADLAEQARQG
ncbi:response regulator transcription factor [Phaeobacter gallaeciensis]|uniref:response regulator transcription factor n=1 Tax=Phaeobacter gallaeciensis TaxID=60890 RepID=UPI000BBBD220|nr:response regulator [Phaeobacter gallaeciensis]ATF18678.1 two-component system response regulator [Phaeobacter gallaeciensis]ATF22787.1 two-component system response regulator [Phaeobacter gallaeciensis]